MPTVVLACPHCRAEHVTVDLYGARDQGRAHDGIPMWSFVGFCRKCGLGISFLADVRRVYQALGGLTPDRLITTVHDDVTSLLNIGLVWPEPDAPTAPEHLPEDVERAFLQAEAGRAAKHNEAAAAMYRRALERGVKHLHGSFASELAERRATLSSVVKKLAEQHKVTPAIADWADEIRELGNNGAHDRDPPTDDEIEDLANLTRMALIYLFEMPARVAQMRARRSGASAP